PSSSRRSPPGPASLLFWAFWVAHTLIAACAVYDIVVLGYRPCWNDLGRALIVSAGYVALVVPINGWLGSNYGYLGNPAAVSEVPPFVHALGPWPQRAIILVALVPLRFVAVLLPWLILGRRRKFEPLGEMADAQRFNLTLLQYETTIPYCAITFAILRLLGF